MTTQIGRLENIIRGEKRLGNDLEIKGGGKGKGKGWTWLPTCLERSYGTYEVRERGGNSQLNEGHAKEKRGKKES